MNVKSVKINLFLIFSYLGLLLLIFFISHKLIISDFLALEKNQNQNNINIILSSMNSDIKNISNITNDYSKWDDSYDFILTSDQDYLYENFREGTNTLQALDVDFMIYSNNKQKILFSKYENKILNSDNKEFENYILERFKNSKQLNTIIKYKSEYLYLIKSDILKSDETGQVNGWIYSGKVLTNQSLSKISKAFNSVKIDTISTPKIDYKIALSHIKDIKIKTILDNKNLKNIIQFYDDSNLHIFSIITMNTRDIIIQSKKTIITFNLIIDILLLIIFFSIYKYQSMLVRNNKMLEVKVKEAISASKAKDTFLASMSHEIRTPLNAIMGFIDILRENETDKGNLKYLNIITTSSKSLLSIINDILDFTKIETNMLCIEKITFNTKKEFQSIVMLFQSQLDGKNIQLHFVEENIPKFLEGDSLRINQVITNLLSNAIKFTPQGKNIYLTIKYNNNLLLVNVRDEGIGIGEEYAENIFKPFTQEDTSTTRKYGGSGLGLAISFNLIKKMGGELSLNLTNKIGSEFYFSLPIKEVKKSVKINETTITSGETFENLKVLVVEDNKSNQLFIKIILKKLNFKFEIANDGVEAIEMYKNNKYDIILMDENMPNMNGIEATQYILEYEKEHNKIHTPIIALTANAIIGDRERFLEAGMDEYLTKPITKDRLFEMIIKVLNNNKGN